MSETDSRTEYDPAIGPNECMAMRYLNAAGWTTPAIAIALEYKPNTAAKHTHGRCRHESLSEPLRFDPLDGEEIRQYRHDAGMTQGEVAAELGIGASAVSKWECGKSCPRGENLRDLYDVFGIEDTKSDT